MRRTTGLCWAWATVAALVAGWPGQPAAAQAGAASVAAQGQPRQQGAPTPKPAEKVGLARLDADWPDWLTVTLVDRMRVDSTPLPGAVGGPYDNYFLNRFRITVGARFARWGQVTVQGQDARVSDFEVAPARNVQKPFDLRLAYAELGRKAPRGVTAAIGRQELTFGDGRLMASPDWGNVGRTYDGARLAVFLPGFKLELFGAAPVDVNLDFSRGKYGERVAGAWSTFDRVRPLGYLEVYELAKHNHTATGETGSKGEQRVYATGVRLGGPLGRSIAWESESIIERGHSAADSISAWATHAAVYWTIGKSAWKPRLGADCNVATGDRNPKDGVKQTFDQMYASTHGKWGLGDLAGWRNLRHAAVKLDLAPTRKLRLGAALNKLQLATVSDAWYGVSGAKLVTNRAATSRDLGWEPDVSGTYTVTRDLTIGAGYAVLFGGDFVRQSTKFTRVRTPYVMSTLKF